MLRKLLAGLGLGALAALIVLAVAASSDLLERYELTTYDWRMRLAAAPQAVNKDIVFVELNDLSIRELQQGFHMRWPWPRVALGLAIEFLRRAPAKVIAVDMSFPEHDYVVTYVFDDPKTNGAGPTATRIDGQRQKVGQRRAGGRRRLRRRSRGDRTRMRRRGADRRFTQGRRAAADGAGYQSLTDAAAALGHNHLVRDGDATARRMSPSS
jgi:hypothetical protein